MALRIGSVTFDCRNPRTLTYFWKAALNYVAEEPPTAERGLIVDPRDRDVELLFIRVPEGKQVKNRVHLDLGADDREAEVRRLVLLGATEGESIGNWTVMRDPEGNEFCVIQVSADDPVENWRTS